MASLYELKNEIITCFDTETGEILDEQRFYALNDSIEEKLENVALWIKNLRADKSAYQDEKKAFEEKIKQTETKIESLTKYLNKALDGESFKTQRVTVSYRKSETVEVSPDAELDFDYVRIKKEPDKAALKKALKAGEQIDGVRLVEHSNMQIK